MTPYRRIVAISLLIAALGGFAATARAETPKPESNLQGVARTLADPERKVVLAKDRSLLVVFGKTADVTIGAGGQVKTHKPGSVAIRFKLTEGLPISLAQAMGHEGIASTTELVGIARLLSKKDLHVHMRRNDIGFRGKHYTAQNRPLDIKSNDVTASVSPSGKLTMMRPRRRGKIGFRAPTVKARR